MYKKKIKKYRVDYKKLCQYSERCRRMCILTETQDHFPNVTRGMLSFMNTSGFLERRHFDSGP